MKMTSSGNFGNYKRTMKNMNTRNLLTENVKLIRISNNFLSRNGIINFFNDLKLVRMILLTLLVSIKLIKHLEMNNVP